VVAKWRSFEAVTGETRDDSLAQANGGLIAVVGGQDEASDFQHLPRGCSC
jgi:hypothetical protein